MFDRRAVSDAVAFVLVFSMILMSIGLVYTFGMDSIGSMQTGEQLKNGERTFLTIERNFDDVRRREAPARSAEMNLNGGTIQVREGSSMWVSVDVAGGGYFNRTLQTNALSYSYRNTFIEYESGTVFRRSDDASIMLTEPALRCVDGDDDGVPEYAVVSVVRMVSPDTVISGSGVVTITGERTSSNLVFPANRSDVGVDVTVSVAGPNEEGWNRKMDAADDWASTPSGNYTCQAPGGLDRVYVRRTVLNVSLNG
ncbi:MAG: hypothetical protein V5A37_06690 [Halobacteriales archaeon]